LSFVVVPFIRRVAGQVLIVNIIGLIQVTGNVRFGSIAALQHDISPTAASGGKAAVRDHGFEYAGETSEKMTVNVRFSQ